MARTDEIARSDSTSASHRPVEEEADHQRYEELRYRAFDRTWSRIEGAIKAVLKKIDRDLFEEVHEWVLERFRGMESARADCSSEISQPYPVFSDGIDAICTQIPTGLILTRNAEVVDDLPTFRELGSYLKSKGCHVAYFSSHDFESKHGAGNCIRSLLRQVAAVAPDVPDISVLASWYGGRGNAGKSVVIIVDDTEQCNGSTLGEFIMILREWAIKIPVILILGVATSISAPKKLLNSNVLQHLQPFKFTLKSSYERMNSIVEAVLVRQYFGFCVGYKVASFLRNYFLNHDGTLTSFIKALKISCTKHFYMEPLSFLGCVMLDENSTHFLEKDAESLPKKLIVFAFNLPSCNRECFDEISGKALLGELHKIAKLQKSWSSALLCLFEVGKVVKIPLLDLFCDALNPGLYTSASNFKFSKTAGKLHKEKNSGLTYGGSILQVVQKVRDLPVETLINILKLWEEHCQEISDLVHYKVNDLLMMLLRARKEMTLKQECMHAKWSMDHCSVGTNMSTEGASSRAATILDMIVRDYLKPIECIPFHELICFKDVSILQEALIGDPRRTIQVDLHKSGIHIQCGCCPRDTKVIVSSMHDTSVIYSLAQDFGDLVNLHDWYQLFKESILSLNKKSKRGARSSATKMANATSTHDTTEAMIQARFCLAVKELQITGLLRMPSKRRPDYVQRVAFGI